MKRLFLFIWLLKNIFNQEILVNYNFNNSSNEIMNPNDSKIIIDSTKTLMNEYPYINILKDPPLIDGKKYFDSVDIIAELDNLQKQIESSKISFFNFYQKYYKIIRQTKDFHIIFSYEGKTTQLSNMVLVSPFVIKINKEKKLFLSQNSFIKENNAEEYVPEYDIILAKENISIKSINDQEPFEFIRNFCKDYFTFKNKNAKFTYTKFIIETYFFYSDCPLDFKEFNLNIVYEDDYVLQSQFVSFYVQYANNNNNINLNSNNQINNNNTKFKYFLNFLKKEKENKQKGIITDRRLLKNYLKSKSEQKNIFSDIENEKIVWDIDITNFKCRVDNENKVNVYYQNTFNIEFDTKIDLFSILLTCQKNFLNNDYPIVVIEDVNPGGFILFSMLFQEIVQNLFNNQMKCSIKFGEYKSSIIYKTWLFFAFAKENGDIYESTKEILNDFTTEKLSDKNENKRLKQRPFYVHFAQYYKDFIIRNRYKKPTDIIIYTDGYSFSATSMFIKSLYHFGGAITVGYNGDPETEKKDFDASQSPAFILTSSDMGLSCLSTLKKYGFNFIQIPFGPSYKNQFIEGNLDYPEEFQVTPVDERVEIYNEYDDSLYQEFIDNAKNIFKKYNEEGKCNPDNKNLKMLNEECDKNFDDITHGGYECGDDGKWSNVCKPFYCHKNYYFDYINQKCVKDVIAEKYSNNYSNVTETEEESAQRIKELEEKYNQRIKELGEEYNQKIKDLGEKSNQKIKDLVVEYNQKIKDLDDEKDKIINELEKKVDNLDDDVNKYKGLFIFSLFVVILLILIFLIYFLNMKFKFCNFKKNISIVEENSFVYQIK